LLIPLYRASSLVWMAPTSTHSTAELNGATLSLTGAGATRGVTDGNFSVGLWGVTGSSSAWSADLIRVADDDGTGTLQIEDGGAVQARRIEVNAVGQVTGQGMLIADVALQGGELALGTSLGLLAITGNLSMDDNSRLNMEIAGLTQDAFDRNDGIACKATAGIEIRPRPPEAPASSRQPGSAAGRRWDGVRRAQQAARRRTSRPPSRGRGPLSHGGRGPARLSDRHRPPPAAVPGRHTTARAAPAWGPAGRRRRPGS
jgi:T5SS/PEP-CTERM-associated repeat protein